MSANRIIPITPIWRRYQDLRKKAQKERLAEAQRLCESPEELATEFATSVAHFTSYANLEDHFYPPNRAKRLFAEEIARTNDVVLRLEHQRQLVPSDAPDRQIEHKAGPRVTAVYADRLACEYVDRELLVQRTTSPAQWEDDARNVGGLRLDVLLVDMVDRTPIVGELKLPGDMDPFFALVQALACAAHLVTVNQYERMRLHLPHGNFVKVTTSPQVDIWVLSVDASGYVPGQQPKGKYMPDLQRAAVCLAARLLAQDGIRSSVRRIAGLGIRLDGSATVVSDLQWAWGHSSE